MSKDQGLKRSFAAYAKAKSSVSSEDPDSSTVTIQSKFPSSNFVDVQASKKLMIFYKVFEVVNKLNVSLVHQTEEEIAADLSRKREMVAMLLKKFTEAHRQKLTAEENSRLTFYG